MPSDTHQWVVQIEEAPIYCEDYLTQSECENAGCYWYDNSCHSSPPPEECQDYTSQSACEAAGCYWYNGACYSSPPPPPPEIPWMLIAGVAATAVIGIAIIAFARRRPIHG